MDILKLEIYNYRKFTTLQKLDSLFHHTVSAKMRLSVIPFLLASYVSENRRQRINSVIGASCSFFHK